MTLFNQTLSFVRRYPSFKQFLKFCIVGGTAAMINFSVYYSFTAWLEVWYVYSAIWAFLISAVFNFTSNKLWTFRNNEIGLQVVKQLVKFAIVMTLGLAINTSIIYGLTDLVKINWLLSWVVATGVVTFWNFGFNRLWTFRKRKNEAPELPSTQI
ncbi:MAG: GtrA family protein [Candidatus Buchananbacteria bacterium]|nr:GtrA family protein [Candidatus Buchananbacteria bacterium]